MLAAFFMQQTAYPASHYEALIALFGFHLYLLLTPTLLNSFLLGHFHNHSRCDTEKGKNRSDGSISAYFVHLALSPRGEVRDCLLWLHSNDTHAAVIRDAANWRWPTH